MPDHFVIIHHGRSGRAGLYRVTAKDRREAMSRLVEARLFGNAVTEIEFCEPSPIEGSEHITAVYYLPSEDGNLD